MIKQFFKIDEAYTTNKLLVESMQSIIADMETAVNAVGGRKFSVGWLAGIIQALRSPSSHQNRLISKYENGQLDNEDEIKEAKTTKIVYDKLHKMKLIDKIGSTYQLPPSNQKSRLEKLSTFKSAAVDYKAEKEKDVDVLKKYKKVLTAAEYAAAQDYINSLPEEKLEAFNVFNALEEEEIAYLKFLADKRDQAKESKVNYTSYVLDQVQNGSEYANKLHALNIINDDGTLNLKLINNIKSIFDDNNIIFKLKPVAKTLYYQMKRLSSDMAYAENSMVKRLSGGDVSAKASEIKNQLNPHQQQDLVNLVRGGRILPLRMQKFQQLGLIDQNNKFTDLGHAVATMVRLGKDSIEDVHNDIKGATGRLPGMGKLDPSMPDKKISDDRGVKRMQDIKSRSLFSDFIKNR